MKIKIKILTILFLLIVFAVSHVYAIDMFLTQDSNNNASASITENEVVDEFYEDDASESQDNTNLLITSNPQDTIGTTTQSSPTVTKTSSVQDNTLTLSDIIDIILIAVCVVLILLAIAILIRCK